MIVKVVSSALMHGRCCCLLGCFTHTSGCELQLRDNGRLLTRFSCGATVADSNQWEEDADPSDAGVFAAYQRHCAQHPQPV